MAWSIGGGATQYESASTNASSITAWCDIYWSSYDSYAGYSTGGRINIGGIEYGYGGPSEMNYVPYYPYYGSRSGGVRVGEKNVGWGHDANNGWRESKVTHVYFNGGGGYAPGDLNYNTPDFGALDFNHSANTPYYDDITRTSLDTFRLGHAETGNASGYGGTSYIMRSARGDITTEGSHGSFDPYTGYTFSVFAAGPEGGWVAGTYNGNSWGPYYGKPRASVYTKASGSTTTTGQIDLMWNAPTNSGSSGYGNVQYYHIYRNGTRIFTSQTITSTSISDTGLTRGDNYYYDIYALGSSYWGDAASTYTYLGNNYIVGPGVPNAPGTPAVTSKVGRTLTLNSTRGSNAYGNAISEYRIQLSTDNGATWKGWNNTTKAFTANGTYNTLDGSGNFTYQLLTPALTYKWRVYAVNSIVTAGATPEYSLLSSATFVGAGGKRWVGDAWEPTSTSKRWDGTTWADFTTAKRWDGNTWADLT